jgi:hypothetical protein
VLSFEVHVDHLCGVVVSIPGYSSRSPGFESWIHHILLEVLGLEQDPISPVKIIEELLE